MIERFPDEIAVAFIDPAVVTADLRDLVGIFYKQRIDDASFQIRTQFTI